MDFPLNHPHPNLAGSPGPATQVKSSDSELITPKADKLRTTPAKLMLLYYASTMEAYSPYVPCLEKGVTREFIVTNMFSLGSPVENLTKIGSLALQSGPRQLSRLVPRSVWKTEFARIVLRAVSPGRMRQAQSLKGQIAVIHLLVLAERIQVIGSFPKWNPTQILT